MVDVKSIEILKVTIRLVFRSTQKEMDDSRLLQAVPDNNNKREDSFEMILLTLYNICIVVLLETLNLLPSKFSFAVTPSTTDRFESRGEPDNKKQEL